MLFCIFQISLYMFVIDVFIELEYDVQNLDRLKYGVLYYMRIVKLIEQS